MDTLQVYAVMELTALCEGVPAVSVLRVDLNEIKWHTECYTLFYKFYYKAIIRAQQGKIHLFFDFFLVSPKNFFRLFLAVFPGLSWKEAVLFLTLQTVKPDGSVSFLSLLLLVCLWFNVTDVGVSGKG
jgi:hypothetical protein